MCEGIQVPFLWQNKLFLRKCSVSVIYLWVSSGLFRRVGITGISLQPAVFRLHVALIDFSPSLLKCTIDQYSNKSSFILEKCSFQLSGHEVLALSMWPRERHRPVFGLGPHLPNMAVHHHHDTTTTHTYFHTYIPASYGPSTEPVWRLYLHPQWQLYSGIPWKGSSGFSQGHTFNVRQQPKVFSIHHCQDFML